jgi:hypothetical protein
VDNIAGALTLLCPQVGIAQCLHVHPQSPPFTTACRRPSVPRRLLLPILAGNLRQVGHGSIAKVAGQGRDLLRIPPLNQVRRLVGPLLRPLARRIASVLPRPAGVGGRPSGARDAGGGDASCRGHGRTDLSRRADDWRTLLLVLVALLAERDALGLFRHGGGRM